MKGANSALMRTLLCALAFMAVLNLASNASDFPRYLYRCPPQSANPWDELQAIGANLIWGSATNTNLSAYLNSLYSHGMQSVLRRAGWPYPVEYYSQAQYMKYQADME